MATRLCESCRKPSPELAGDYVVCRACALERARRIAREHAGRQPVPARRIRTRGA